MGSSRGQMSPAFVVCGPCLCTFAPSHLRTFAPRIERQMADETALAKPAPQPSWVERFVARARGEIQAAPPASAASYVRETGSVVGEFIEGGAVGSMLGATHAKWGLDSKNGPIDAMIAGFSAILAVGASGHFPDIANHLRKIGAQAFTVFAFRKGYQAVKHEPLAGGTAPGVTRITLPGKGPGVTGEDPIEAVAKGLDE